MRNYRFLPRHLALQLGAEQPESAYFLTKNRKQSKISTVYTNMGLGVGGRGDTKPGRKGREGKMGAACSCVRFEQTVMILRAKIQGRYKHGGFCPVTSGRGRGNEGS